jgi:hypothetical protein
MESLGLTKALLTRRLTTCQSRLVNAVASLQLSGAGGRY